MNVWGRPEHVVAGVVAVEPREAVDVADLVSEGLLGLKLRLLLDGEALLHLEGQQRKETLVGRVVHHRHRRQLWKKKLIKILSLQNINFTLAGSGSSTAVERTPREQKLNRWWV